MGDRPASQLLRVLGAAVRHGGPAGVPDGACWLWDQAPFFGPLDPAGYAVVRWPRGGIVGAYRLAWEWSNGGVKPPAGCEVDHVCRVRACVNPAHLQVVDGYGNTARQSLTAEQHCGLALDNRSPGRPGNL